MSRFKNFDKTIRNTSRFINPFPSMSLFVHAVFSWNNSWSYSRIIFTWWCPAPESFCFKSASISSTASRATVSGFETRLPVAFVNRVVPVAEVREVAREKFEGARRTDSASLSAIDWESAEERPAMEIVSGAPRRADGCWITGSLARISII